MCGKILEQLIYNKMFEFFIENELISQNQSGFQPEDLCINQLLCIAHDIYQSLNGSLKTKGVFFDKSKAFDKIWIGGLLHTIMQNGMSGNLLNVITDVSCQRKQRVVLNAQHLPWTYVEAGGSQGSIIELLFFLIYINYLSDGLTSNSELFTDCSFLSSVIQNINSAANNLNSDSMKISEWSFQWNIDLNPELNSKAQGLIFSRKN